MKNAKSTRIQSEATTFTLCFEADVYKIEETIERFVSRRTLAELTFDNVTRVHSRYFIFDGMFKRTAFAVEINIYYSEDDTKLTVHAFGNGEIPDELITSRIALLANKRLSLANSLKFSRRLQEYLQKKLTESGLNQKFPNRHAEM